MDTRSLKDERRQFPGYVFGVHLVRILCIANAIFGLSRTICGKEGRGVHLVRILCIDNAILGLSRSSCYNPLYCYAIFGLSKIIWGKEVRGVCLVICDDSEESIVTMPKSTKNNKSQSALFPYYANKWVYGASENLNHTKQVAKGKRSVYDD